MNLYQRYSCRCGGFEVIGSQLPDKCKPCPKCNTIPAKRWFKAKKCTTDHDWLSKLDEQGLPCMVCQMCGLKKKI